MNLIFSASPLRRFRAKALTHTVITYAALSRASHGFKEGGVRISPLRGYRYAQPSAIHIAALSRASHGLTTSRL